LAHGGWGLRRQGVKEDGASATINPISIILYVNHHDG